MTHEQLKALMNWIDARINEKIEDATGRGSLQEAIREDDMRLELEDVMGFIRRTL